MAERPFHLILIILLIHMNKCFFITAVMAPAMCLVSCSDPQESAQGQMEDFLEGVANVVHRSEGDSAEEFIDDLHGYVCGKAPGLVDSLLELKDAERKAVLRGVVKSEALRELIKRVAQAAIARGIDDKELIKACVKARSTNDPEKAFEAVEEVLPYETRIQAVEIAAAWVKIGVALGVDDQEVLMAALPALLEVAQEYGVDVSSVEDLQRMF